MATSCSSPSRREGNIWSTLVDISSARMVTPLVIVAVVASAGGAALGVGSLLEQPPLLGHLVAGVDEQRLGSLFGLPAIGDSGFVKVLHRRKQVGDGLVERP